MKYLILLLPIFLLACQSQQDHYKDYDWLKVWSANSVALKEDMLAADFSTLDSLSVPLVLLEGRHDWNVPSLLALEWYNQIKAPKKLWYWFEGSGHGPLEEEPDRFNEVMNKIPTALRR